MRPCRAAHPPLQDNFDGGSLGGSANDEAQGGIARVADDHDLAEPARR